MSRLCIRRLAHFTLISFIYGMSCLACFSARAQDTPPIVEIKGVTVQRSAFQRPTKPVEIKSMEDAAKHLTDEGLAKLKAKVDFEKQRVVLFAWRGSGQDKIQFNVAESFPEQVMFHYKPGRTRDLRPHVKVYALRLNVKYSMKK